MTRFSLRELLGVITLIAAILAVPALLEPAILACWLLALWRKTRTPFLIGASVVAFPAWVVASNAYAMPRSLAPREPIEEYRVVARQRWREYQPENRVRATWVLGAMLVGGGLYSFGRGRKQ